MSIPVSLSRRSFLWVVICWCLPIINTSAETTSTDVYERVLQVAADIDLLRLEMGIPDFAKADIAIADAQPREVYFQAQTLFEKSNRLLFEQLRERADQPTLSRSDRITPDDVLTLVRVAHELIVRVKQSFGIDETATIAALSNTHSPTQVYKQIINANRALNALLRQKFEPAEVYQQITYGVGLVAEILGTIDGVAQLGDKPAFERRKTPRDVYRRLISIYTIIHETMMLSGETSLLIEAMERERNDVMPSDVYDLASLIVSELSYLHDLAPGVSAPKKSYYPGYKLPSHVYQRAGRLESQVKTLYEYAVLHPDWLKMSE